MQKLCPATRAGSIIRRLPRRSLSKRERPSRSDGLGYRVMGFISEPVVQILMPTSCLLARPDKHTSPAVNSRQCGYRGGATALPGATKNRPCGRPEALLTTYLKTVR